MTDTRLRDSLRNEIDAGRFTQRILNPLQGDDWTVLHGVDLEDWRLDHVLLGPRGVVSIETKFRSCNLVVEPGAPWLDPIVERVSEKAATLRSLLWLGGVRTEVLPAIVLWGAHLTGPTALVMDEVLIAQGKDPNAWIGRLESLSLSGEEVGLAMKAIQQRDDAEWAVPLFEPGALAV